MIQNNFLISFIRFTKSYMHKLEWERKKIKSLIYVYFSRLETCWIWSNTITHNLIIACYAFHQQVFLLSVFFKEQPFK